MKRHREKVDKGWRDRYEQVGREISAHDVVRLVSGFPISRDQCSSTIWHSFSQLCFAVFAEFLESKVLYRQAFFVPVSHLNKPICGKSAEFVFLQVIWSVLLSTPRV